MSYFHNGALYYIQILSNFAQERLKI